MGKINISWNKLKKYSGLWVAIAEEEILTSGRSLEEVMKKVDASGKKAEVFQVPLEGEVYILAFDFCARFYSPMNSLLSSIY